MKKKKKKTGKKSVSQLVPRAGLALKNEFYLETSMIVSSMIEKKLRNVITRVEKRNPGSGFGIGKCVKRLKYLILKNADPLIVKYFEIRLIDELRNWKNYRNSILRDMCEIHITRNRLQKMAEDGIVLMQELNSSYKKFKQDWKKGLIKKPEIITNPDEITA
jgi:hypothetical protein